MRQFVEFEVRKLFAGTGPVYDFSDKVTEGIVASISNSTGEQI